MTEFFVVMVKRKDGKIYADLHKTDGIIYLSRKAAEANVKPHFHVVRLVAEYQTDYFSKEIDNG